MAAADSEKTRQRIFWMSVARLETTRDPLKLFAHDKKRLKRAYDSYDVSVAKGHLR
jgi:hypothetical protein